jgi:hypothetical protein
MNANGGSTSYRNIPDVALAADNVFVKYSNGSGGTFGGTSCAAPLWAGFTALLNQQAAAAGRPSVGFLNPAIYALGESSKFNTCFHDITAGNNYSANSPNLFNAATGYDLCTGWGTPAGEELINALAGVANALVITPSTGVTSSGPVGGPFTPSSNGLSLTNSGSTLLTWSLINTSAWLTVSLTNGTLAPGATAHLSADLGAAAYSLAPGTYQASLRVSNDQSGEFDFIVTLLVGQSLVQNGDFETGDFSGWTLTGNTSESGNIYNAVENSDSGFNVQHSGSYGAFLGDTQVATLSQTITTVPDQFYLLSLWLDNPTAGSTQRFSISWNRESAASSPLFALVNPPSFSWTNLQFLVSATGRSTMLEIQAENDPSYFGLDDVSATPVPLPGFKTVGKAGDSFQLSWNTMPGLVYRVQYKNDLLETNWINLGNGCVATNYASDFIDTNAFNYTPMRFYRLIVTP